MQKTFAKWLKLNSAIFGALLVVGGGLIVYLYFDVANRLEEVLADRVLFNARSQGIASIAALREESKKGAGYLVQLQEILPKKDDLFNFSRALDAAARNRKVNLSFAFGADAGGVSPGTGAITFTITTTGTYADTMNFIRDMETSKFLVIFDTFDIVRAGMQTYSTTITGQVFYRTQ